MQLTVEEKRQAVYSSLCRYAPEAVSLRQRAIHRVVLGALIGSSPQEPFRIGRIQENLSFGSVDLEVRTETIQEALDSLIKEGKAIHLSLRDRHAYHLTTLGEEEVSRLAVSSEQLFDQVTTHLFRDTADFLPIDVATHVFRKFAFECFARFGGQIARSVTGTITRDDLVQRVDARAAFEAAIHKSMITPEQREILSMRCQLFLTSSEQSCDKLKFYLTQGYYFTQLVGLEQAKFNPLAEDAFSGAVFYLDTNVLMIGLLYGHEQVSQFVEMIRLAERLGIELRVTYATTNEARKALEDRMPQMQKIVEVLPEELAERTTDQMLQAYYRRRSIEPSLTPEEFYHSFDDIEGRIQEQWHIITDGRDAFEIIEDRDIQHIAEVMNEEAENSRGRGKSALVLKHDVAHCLLVIDERVTNPKTWFLTRDRSLQAVAERLQPTGRAFSFSHIGFLQAISPFITSPAEEMSLADVMAAFISDQFRPIESLFDLSELSLMAEFHEDVMATPPEQLVMAFDYIKSHTLHGKNYREADIPRVSLELRKFLAADRNEQFLTLQAEKLRLSEEKRAEKELRLEAEEKTNRAVQRGNELEEEVAILQSTLSKTQSLVEDVTHRFNLREEQLFRNKQQGRLNRTILGIFVGLILWLWRSELATIVTSRIPIAASNHTYINVVLGLVAGLLFALPAAVYIQHTRWSLELKRGVIGFVSSSVIILALVDAITNKTLSTWLELLSIGMILGSLIAAIVLNKKQLEIEQKQ